MAKEEGQAICAGPEQEDILPFWERLRSHREEFGFCEAEFTVTSVGQAAGSGVWVGPRITFRQIRY